MQRTHLRTAGVAVAAVVICAVPFARVRSAQIPENATVEFGQPLPQAPGSAGRILVPNDVTILKGGTVTFHVNGPGHGIAIYPVSRKTSRDDVIADLCPHGPGGPCTGSTADPAFLITDHKGDAVVDIPATSGSPIFDVAPGRVLKAIAGSGIFLNGAVNATPAQPGVQIEHRFEKTGRFLVICMNRFHAINDYMFGFVSVVGDEDEQK